MKTAVFLLALFGSSLVLGQAPTLDLPARNADSPTGMAFAKQIESLPLRDREEQIFKQVENGNVPDFLRHFCAVEVSYQGHTGHIFVAPDYLAVGTDEDYFFVPMTPYTAQRIADMTHCSLPTPKIADSIDQAAQVKLEPTPIDPTPAMTTVPVFETHNQMVRSQRSLCLSAFPLGALTVGDKKDIVICKALAEKPGKVAIYGWFHLDGSHIQPLYLGHTASWADYSHGVRLISDMMELDGRPAKVEDVLKDPSTAGILSSEGPLLQPRYVFTQFPTDWSEPMDLPAGERIESFNPYPAVRAWIDEPVRARRQMKVLVYALPNGSTIEQTFGKKMKPGDDWHFDIQHIGAQTRFLRSMLKDEDLAVVYLEASGRAWPTWLHGKPQGVAPQIIDAVMNRFKKYDFKMVLDSHSGGGALLFAYIRDVDRIPDNIERIAFLDSEYNYETTVHLPKLTEWLRRHGHYLCAIAYDDASALYRGKPFVSAEGGTWGRTHQMLRDLSQEFAMKRVNGGDPAKWEGLGGRIVFWLKENPNHEIFHTVQVEKNGFIESILSGLTEEGRGYTYFGPRAYSHDVR